MDYTQIRQDLKNAGIEAEEIKEIIRIVDRFDRREAVNKAKASTGIEYIWAGGTLMVIGIGIFIVSHITNFSYWIFPFGAIGTGSFLLAIGRGKMRR